MTEAELLRDIEGVVAVYEEIIGDAAQRTRNMIKHDGPIGALSKLAVSADLQSGFRTLRDQDMLDQSFEALIVKYPDLFSRDVVAAARWRLDNPNDLL